jgi:hypothetical protein
MSEKIYAGDFAPGAKVVENWRYMQALETIQQLREVIDEAMAAAERSCDPDCCYVSEILTKALQEQGK